MSKYLTQCQSEVLQFISSQIAENGIAPTYTEIGRHFGYCPSNAYLHVDVLVRKGHIHRVKGISRGITLTDTAAVEMPDINDSEYWYEGVFKPQLYQRDVVDAIKSAGMKVKEFA